MSRVGWGSKLGRRKNIWEDLRQAGGGRFKVIELRRPEGQHEGCSQGGSLGWTAQGMQGP